MPGSTPVRPPSDLPPSDGPPSARPARRRAATPRRHAALIARALAHIDTHLDQPLDASTLADRAAMSRHHFHRVFHALVGCPVAEYVTWRRLQRAAVLLGGTDAPVLQVALAVGYDSAQALAKAMRRLLGGTPSALRRGDIGALQRLWHPAASFPHRLVLQRQAHGDAAPDGHRPGSHPPPPAAAAATPETPMSPTRFATTPALVALTATARGMVGHNMGAAARQAFTELEAALARHQLFGRVGSWIAICPDDAKGPDDPEARYVAGVVLGHAMHLNQGVCQQVALPLDGTLAWWPIAAGRFAVFTHIGPYTTLHQSWHAIYRDWLPASGERLRDAAPMELMLNSPQDTPPEQLHTEIWIPIA